ADRGTERVCAIQRAVVAATFGDGAIRSESARVVARSSALSEIMARTRKKRPSMVSRSGKHVGQEPVGLGAAPSSIGPQVQIGASKSPFLCGGQIATRGLRRRVIFPALTWVQVPSSTASSIF